MTIEDPGTHDTGVVPSVNTWYRFIVEVEDVSGSTAIRVKVWEDNTTEPTTWQIDTTDQSSPLTNGTFGLWAYNNGSKYWDDLAVESLTSAPANTPMPTNTPEPGSTATPTNTPAATSIPTATPDPGQPAVIQRSTYTIAGQAIALRVVEKDADSPSATILSNRLYYFHTDHLGSNSAMSDDLGAFIANSTSRYTPFGDWRAEPTVDLTDRGYTGHKSNNLGSNGIGMIYMNARYFVVGLSRFASADSIIPDPTSPQSFNRFSYVENRPINLIDPTGHTRRQPLADIDGWTIGLGATAILVVAMQNIPDDIHFDWSRVALWESGRDNEGMWAVHEANQAAQHSDEENVQNDLQELAGSVSGSPGDFDPNDGNNTQRNIQFSERQLQKKFRHASDFGIEGNYSSANGARFKEAIESHTNSSNTQVIEGTYRGQSVTHYFDPVTELNVIVDSNNNFVSGWRLSVKQIEYLINTGALGGG